jgi:hypothetical protein
VRSLYSTDYKQNAGKAKREREALRGTRSALPVTEKSATFIGLRRKRKMKKDGLGEEGIGSGKVKLELETRC